MIDVVEQFELDGIAGSADRFDAIDDGAADAVDEVAVEESNGGVEARGEFGAPIVPGIEIQVGAGDALAAAIEDVHEVAVTAAGD